LTTGNEIRVLKPDQALRPALGLSHQRRVDRAIHRSTSAILFAANPFDVHHNPPIVSPLFAALKQI
jgi:hypothetical protein